MFDLCTKMALPFWLKLDKTQQTKHKYNPLPVQTLTIGYTCPCVYCWGRPGAWWSLWPARLHPVGPQHCPGQTPRRSTFYCFGFFGEPLHGLQPGGIFTGDGPSHPYVEETSHFCPPGTHSGTGTRHCSTTSTGQSSLGGTWCLRIGYHLPSDH